jgi:tRNA(fMet)-specific endonuclease VapC
MALVLDTCAYTASQAGLADVNQALAEADEIILGPHVVAELLLGFRMGQQEKQNRTHLRKFLAGLNVRFVESGGETAEAYSMIAAYLRQEGLIIPINDIWVAALACEHDCEVLTTDRHFLRIPHIRTQYFEPA